MLARHGASYPDPASLRARDVAQDPGTPSCLDVATQWLHDCLGTHQRCREAIGLNPKLPKRVIDVGDENESPRLFETNGISANYAALSYCWGLSPSLTLTRKDLGSFMKEIPGMPKTLEDAVAVTRGVGLRYLWIDALCIIQDSPEDWREQVACIKDIYGDATLTIFAPHAASSTEGFLQKRVAREEVSLLWRKSPQLPPGVVFVRLRKHHDDGMDDRFSSHRQWIERGWTLQEYVSAGRRLIFTKHQTNWHCFTCISTESGEPVGQIANQSKKKTELATGMLVDVSDRWAELVRMPDPRRHGIDMDAYHHSLVSQFYAFVHHFLERVFTYQADKLPATVALAKAAEAQLEGRDRYWAGLWESNLAEGLGWEAQTLKPGVDYGRPLWSGGSHVCVPSWSWASVILSYYGPPREYQQSVPKDTCSSHEVLGPQTPEPKPPTQSSSRRFYKALVLKFKAHGGRLTPLRRFLIPKSAVSDADGIVFDADGIVSDADGAVSDADGVSDKTQDVRPSTLPREVNGLDSLLKNIKFPDLDDEQERFIPTRPLQLKFTAPFQRLSDNWARPNKAVDRACPELSVFEEALRCFTLPAKTGPECSGNSSDDHKPDLFYGARDTEFAQKHQPYPGQIFAAIQIYKEINQIWDREGYMHRLETITILLLESTPLTTDSSQIQQFRRVGKLDIRRGNHRLRQNEFVVWMGKSGYRDVLDMLRKKPWSEREIVLI